MIEINLIPDVKLELIKAKRSRTKVVTFSILAMIVSIGLVVVLAVYAFGVQTVRGVLDDNSIKSGYKDLSSVSDISKILTIQNQLSKISEFNNSKKMYSRMFDILTSIIPASPNQVQVSSLSINANEKTVTVEGQAQNSYAALEVFKKTLKGAKIQYTDSDGSQQTVDLASDIVTSNTSYGEDTSGAKVLRFTLVFTYAEEAFAPSSEDVSTKISVSGNQTDSYLGVPTSIFTTRATDLTEEQ